jgi:hypothetical protein
MKTRVTLLTAALLAGLGASAWHLLRAPQPDTAGPVTTGAALDPHAPPGPAPVARATLAYLGSTDPEARTPESVDLGSGEATPVDHDEPGSHLDAEAEAVEQVLARQESEPAPPERSPVDHRALGYESEQALLEAVRASMDIPAERSLVVYTEMVNGEPMITIAVGVPETPEEEQSAR